MNNRTILTGLAILILGGLVALIVALGRDGEHGDGATPSASRDRGPASAASDAPRPNDRPRPRLAARPGADPGTVTVVDDDAIAMRDHRANPPEPSGRTHEPVVPLGAPRKMMPAAITAVRNALRNVVRHCQETRTGTNTGDKPQIQAVVTVSVVNEMLTADAINVTGDGISDLGDMSTCVRDGFAGTQIAVPGQPDIAGFRQTHPFRMGR